MAMAMGSRVPRSPSAPANYTRLKINAGKVFGVAVALSSFLSFGMGNIRFQAM